MHFISDFSLVLCNWAGTIGFEQETLVRKEKKKKVAYGPTNEHPMSKIPATAQAQAQASPLVPVSVRRDPGPTMTRGRKDLPYLAIRYFWGGFFLPPPTSYHT